MNNFLNFIANNFILFSYYYNKINNVIVLNVCIYIMNNL